MEVVSLLTGPLDLIWSYVLPFVIVLSILVFVHEYGHYWVAKQCGVRIDTFSIGFGRELFGFNDKHGTRWKVSLIPLGGYVKMYGDADPTSMRSEEAAAAEEEDGGMHHFAEAHAAPRPMTPEERAQSFHYKPLWQRTAVVAAGPGANFIFAILVLAAMFMTVGQPYTPPELGTVEPEGIAAQAGLQSGDVIVRVDGRRINRYEQFGQEILINQGSPVRLEIARGDERFEVTLTPAVTEITNRLGTHTIGDIGAYPIDPPTVETVQAGSAADRAGFQPGDLITGIDGEAVRRFTEVQTIIADSPGIERQITVERDGRSVTLTATPEPVTVTREDGVETEIGRLGITKAIVAYERYGPVSAFGRATEETWRLTVNTLRTVGQILTGSRDASQIGGPLRIAQFSGETAQGGWASFITFMALLSVNLGLINLFPIPMLDGGHLLFYAIEAVRGRPLGPRAQEYGFRFGLALVLSLAVFALWNDLVHLNVVSTFTSLFS